MKTRLDVALVERGLCPTRTKAQAALLAGQVRVNGQPSAKPGSTVEPDDVLEMVGTDRYVSRGGHKLEHALHHFHLNVTGTRALDLGASTGGFTDCLLQHGAARVWAVDVGQGQLAWRLRQDPRVVVRERTNARHLHLSDLAPDGAPFDLVVIDCSFISLRRILPVCPPLLARTGRVVALIKPQFEAGRAEADRGAGVITDPAVHQRVVAELEDWVARELRTLRWRGVTESPLLGPAGNKEFLVLLESAAP